MQQGAEYQTAELFTEPMVPANYFKHKLQQEQTLTYDSLASGTGTKTMLLTAGCPYRLRISNDRPSEAVWNQRPRMLHLQHSSIPFTTSRLFAVDSRTPITTASTGYRNSNY